MKTKASQKSLSGLITLYNHIGNLIHLEKSNELEIKKHIDHLDSKYKNQKIINSNSFRSQIKKLYA